MEAAQLHRQASIVPVALSVNGMELSYVAVHTESVGDVSLKPHEGETRVYPGWPIMRFSHSLPQSSTKDRHEQCMSVVAHTSREYYSFYRERERRTLPEDTRSAFHAAAGLLVNDERLIFSIAASVVDDWMRNQCVAVSFVMGM